MWVWSSKNNTNSTFTRPQRRVGVAIGDSVLDVAAVADDLRLPLCDLFTEPT